MRRPTSLTSASLIPDFSTMIMFPPPMLATVYFLKLSICGGPDMAPALPQLADTRFGRGQSVSALVVRLETETPRAGWPAAFILCLAPRAVRPPVAPLRSAHGSQ